MQVSQSWPYDDVSNIDLFGQSNSQLQETQVYWQSPGSEHLQSQVNQTPKPLSGTKSANLQSKQSKWGLQPPGPQTVLQYPRTQHLTLLPSASVPPVHLPQEQENVSAVGATELSRSPGKTAHVLVEDEPDDTGVQFTFLYFNELS